MPGTDPLRAARAAYQRRAWTEAYEGLSALGSKGSLGPEDLDRLGTAAYLELDAARRAFAELGAEPALAQLRELAGAGGQPAAGQPAGGQLAAAGLALDLAGNVGRGTK